MPTALSKYASNQFEVATSKSFPLMTTVLDDAHGRFSAEVLTNGLFSPGLALITNARAQWTYGMSMVTNAEAYQLSKTPAMEAKLASLTHKPDMETASILEGWDNTIRSVTPQGSSRYILLLPHGRETLTRGSINERIDALQNFAIRLSEQATVPALLTLGSAEVSPFAEAANTLREEQLVAKGRVEDLRGDQEQLRLTAAADLYAAVAMGMVIYKSTPWRVDELFDVNLLRGSSQEIPGAPIDTAWDPATRTLSTTAMPTDATHIQAWRQGPGGAPELLAEGGADEQSVGIPSSFTFDPGESYDLWIVGKNSRGTGAKGPVVVWIAP